MGFEQDWQGRFKRFAEANDDDAGIAGWSQTGLTARVRNFQHYWQPARSGSLWIDAGSGAGTYTRYLAAHGKCVLGIDYCLPSVIKARSRLSEGRVWWLAGDVRKLPVADGAADGVLCFGVTQALSDSEMLIRELARVLRPGGQVWLDGLNVWCIPHLWESLLRQIKGKKLHVRYEAPRGLLRIMREEGFTDLNILWVPILPSRLAALHPVLESSLVRSILAAVPVLGMLLSHAFVVTARRI